MPLIARQLLELSTPSLRELAEEIGVPYSTVKAWSAGIRQPTAENAQILADALHARARQLLELADRLKRAAE